jgi:hypothetical protein
MIVVYYLRMTSIHKAGSYIKQKLGYIPFDILLALLICLVGFSAFALGWIARAQYQTPPVEVYKLSFPTDGAASVLVGSRNSDKVHYRWCGGAERINPENRRYFSSLGAAKAAGYQPAENCPGLEALTHP